MDSIYAASIARRSIRNFETKQIPDAVLEHIIEVGRLAPSGSNVQLTHLLVIQNQDELMALQNLVQEIFAEMTFDPNTMFHTLEHSIRKAKEGKLSFFYQAPTLVIACNKQSHPNAFADTACVLDHMMLAAVTQNIGSCWVNQLRWLQDHPVLTEKLNALGMATDETVFGSLALGYAAKQPEGVLPRTGHPVHYIK